MLYLLTETLKKKIENLSITEIKDLSKGELYIVSFDNDLKDMVVRKGLSSNNIEHNAEEILSNQESFEQACQDINIFIKEDCKCELLDALITHPLSLAAECFKYSYFKYADGKDFIWENGAANDILWVVQQSIDYSLNLEDRLKMTLICQKNGADNYFTYAYPYGGCPNNYTTTRGNNNEKKVLNKLLTYSAETFDCKNDEIDISKKLIASEFISQTLKDYIEPNISISNHDERETGGEQTDSSIL